MPLAFVFDNQHALEKILPKLDKQAIAYQVKTSGAKTELWVNDPNAVLAVKKYCQRQFLNQQRTVNIKNLKAAPVTSALIVISLLVALVTQLGSHFIELFLMAQMQYYPRDWFYYEGVGFAWHAISPIFLHFSIEHLVFNALSLWYLGSVLERSVGHVFYSGMIVLLGLLGNFAQLWASGPLFGGLSGVVYGLMAFACVYQYFKQDLGIPKALFYVAAIWLLLGVSGVFSSIGLFNMANAAHIGGLLGGLIFSLAYLGFEKIKPLN